jgi:hypothetical protein
MYVPMYIVLDYLSYRPILKEEVFTFCLKIFAPLSCKHLEAGTLLS